MWITIHARRKYVVVYSNGNASPLGLSMAKNKRISVRPSYLLFHTSKFGSIPSHTNDNFSKPMRFFLHINLCQNGRIYWLSIRSKMSFMNISKDRGREGYTNRSIGKVDCMQSSKHRGNGQTYSISRWIRQMKIGVRGHYLWVWGHQLAPKCR